MLLKPAALFAGLVLLASAQPAAAGDIQGDAYGCEELRQLRNATFKKAGYCFKSQKAIAAYGNEGCRFSSEALLPLSKMDRVVLRDIRRSERRQGC